MGFFKIFFFPCLQLVGPEYVKFLFQTILSLRPSAEKRKKLYKLHKELSNVSYDCDSLGYIARSSDLELFKQVFNQKEVYNGDWTKLEIAVILDWLAEAIRNARPKIINYILNKAENAKLDLSHPAQTVCEDPRASVTDSANIEVLNYAKTADRLRKLWNISKSELDLLWAPTPKIASYILDDPIPHPDHQKAKEQWSKKPDFSTLNFIFFFFFFLTQIMEISHKKKKENKFKIFFLTIKTQANCLCKQFIFYFICHSYRFLLLK